MATTPEAPKTETTIPENVDLDWEPEPLWENWPTGRDNGFILERMEDAFADKAVVGTPGRILDVACGAARHAPELHRRGWDLLALEPSPAMIRKALRTAEESGFELEMYRAIGEAMPFRDNSFDRVLCQSSLDHFADPKEGLREIARILRPGGLAIVGLVNYGGIGCRASRVAYRVLRGLRIVKPGKPLFWDTPVPHEHTWETTLKRLKSMGTPHMDLLDVYGVSMLWAFPGWGSFLDFLPGRVANPILRLLDAGARRMPTMSDFLITTWRAR
jgi:ubiquinone/menaquinone biosynthesis C-methylase UbiE